MKKVFLVGNPNSGKTTFFNALTRSNEHVGNWHGVTIENKEKEFHFGEDRYILSDTPGLYSLNTLSFEEDVAAKAILENQNCKIINLIDINALQRSLYLSLCLLERGLDVVIAINSFDKKPNCQIDYSKIKQMLGVEVLQINASKKETLSVFQNALKQPKKRANLPYFDGKFTQLDIKTQSERRYEYIDKIISLCAKQNDRVYGANWFDKIALNKFFAFPIFLLILAGIFYLTFFSLGSWISQVLSGFLNVISQPILTFLQMKVGSSWVFDLFNVAIFGGLNTILSFLPQVVLLFLFLTILEESGYMARAAFIFDDILGKIGLSGKSVYTLLMGFGCSTSAIMTSRTMEDKNAKIKTALLCPYMSCSAKIPIYTIIGGAFFGAKNIFVIFSLYLLGVVIAICISKILDTTILKSDRQGFILEFPPYRTISVKKVCKTLWKNTKEFALKVGSIILAMNIVVWVLSSFSFKFEYVQNGSMLESFGRLIAPIFTPLGFGNWAIVCCLLAGFVAKEVVVSSLAMFNGVDAGATNLISSSILLSTSVICFKSNAAVLAFLVYCLLYTPCVSSLAMLRQEVGRKWAFFSVISQLVVAYVVAFLVYNMVFAFEVFGFAAICVIVALAIIVLSFVFLMKRLKKKKCCSYCDDCDKICKLRK